MLNIKVTIIILGLFIIINTGKSMRILLLLLSLGIINTVYAEETDSTLSVWSQSYALESSHKYQQAADLIEPLVKKNETLEIANLRLGWLYYLQAKYKKSIDYYTNALNYNSKSIDAHLGLTLPLLAQKRYKSATKHTQQVLSLSPNNYSASAKMMYIYYLQKKWNSLNKFSTNISTYYPNLVEPIVYIARANFYSGKKDMAKKFYQKVLMLMPTHIEANSGVK
jgi:tetratricopeptide (TPR) repeat protein